MRILQYQEVVHVILFVPLALNTMEKFIADWVPSLCVYILVKSFAPENFWFIVIVLIILSLAYELKIENIVQKKLDERIELKDLLK